MLNDPETPDDSEPESRPAPQPADEPEYGTE